MVHVLWHYTHETVPAGGWRKLTILVIPEITINLTTLVNHNSNRILANVYGLDLFSRALV